MAWSNYILSLIVFISTCQALELYGPPRIQGITTSINGKSKEDLVLICKADAPIHWHLPKFIQNEFGYDSGLKNRVEVHNFEDKDVHKKNSYEYRYTATLTIHPTWLDTGNYVCHYKTNDTSMHVAYDRNQKYVYFQDDNNLIVRPKGHDRNVIKAVEFAPLVIPCKPSHPNVTMILNHGDKQVYPRNAFSKWTFDPQEGFKLDMMKPHLYGLYTCAAARGGKYESTKYFVNIGDEAPKPLLDTKRVPDKIAPGDEFHLSCNVSYVAGRDVKLEWIVPSPQGIDGTRIRQGDQMTGSQIVESLIMMTAYRYLHVTQAQDVDQGKYICRSTVRGQTQDAETFVRFKDYPLLEASSKYLKVGDPFEVKCHVTLCGTKSVELYFMECPPGVNCPTGKWIDINGTNDEVVDTSTMGTMQTVTITGRARTSGWYECGSTCYRKSFKKEIVVSDQAVIYNASAKDVGLTEGENIYLFCQARTFSEPAVQWYKDGVNVTEGVTAIVNGSSLLVKSANIGDSGSYSCQFSPLDSRTMNVAVKHSENQIFWVLSAGVLTFIIIVVVVVCIWEWYKRQSKNNRSGLSHCELVDQHQEHSLSSLRSIPRCEMPLPMPPTFVQVEDFSHHYDHRTKNMKPKNNLMITETSDYVTIAEGDEF